MIRPWTDALARMRGRIARTAASMTAGFPHFADPATGAWTTSPAGDWTGGFWNGMLWLAARYGDEIARVAGHYELAERCPSVALRFHA